VLLQSLWKNTSETSRYANALVVFVRERTTITPVDFVTEKRQKIFVYILIVIIGEEIDISKAVSVCIIWKRIDKSTAVRVFVNGRKDR
jgi:hypothetical protein